MAEAKKESKKVKKPTALKRDRQNLTRNLVNRSFKSKVTTAVRSFKNALTQKDAEAARSSLNLVGGLMDRGVKKGVFKLNKARRVKSRFHAEASKALSK